MTRRLIVTLLREDIAMYHKELKEELKQKFGVQQALKTNPPSHITLKYNFKNKELGKVKQLLADFAKQRNPSKYEIGGFDSFDKNVIYLKVRASKEMKKAHTKLLQALKNITPLRKYDKSENYHVTLALRDIGEKYEEIMKYLQNKKPCFQAYFNNVAILKLEKKEWIIEEKYEFT